MPSHPPPPAAGDSGDRPTKGLIIAGAVTLGAGYLIAVIGSAVGLAAVGAASNVDCADSVGFGFIPVVGPFLLAGGYPNYSKYDAESKASIDCRDTLSTVNAVAIIDGVVQVAGVGMLVTGFLVRSPSEPEGLARQPTVTIGPTVSSEHAGMTVTITSF